MIANFLFNFAYQIFAIIIPLITAPYLARILGPTAQGVYGYVHSVTYTISIFTLLGIYNYGTRQIAYVRNNKENLSKNFLEIMALRVLLGIIGTIVFFIIAFIQKEYCKFFMIYYLYLLAQYIDCTWFFVGIENMKIAVIKNFITKIFSTIGIFIWVKKSEDIWIYLLILGISVLVSNILAYSQLKKYIKLIKIDFNSLKIHLKETFKLFLPSIAVLIYMQVDKIMIKLLTHGTEEVAFYENAEKIVTIALTVITVMSTVMMPRMANEYKEKNEKKLKEYVLLIGKISLFIGFPMMIGIMSIAGDLIPWYLGKEYIPVIYGIIILSTTVISNSLESISGKQYFTATNQISILSKAYIITAILNVILNAALIPQMGFIGAAIATVVCSYSCVIIQYYYLTKQVKINELIKFFIKYLIESLIMGVVVIILGYYLPSTFFSTCIEILCGSIVFFGICIISKDEVFFFIMTQIKNKLFKKENNRKCGKKKNGL